MNRLALCIIFGIAANNVNLCVSSYTNKLAMGLDIFISTDKDIKRNGISDSLSRRFVRLILGQHDDNDKEIEQIAKISGIGLTPLLEMELPDTSYL